jgi:hypothetical protein
MRNEAPLAPQEEDCGMPCGGNEAQKCGGPDRLSVYSNESIIVRPVPQLQKTDLPGSWQYVGCLTDLAGDKRTFPTNMLDLPDTNSAKSCLGECSKYGFSAGGMEYGRECYCGELSDPAKVGAEIVPDEQCNMACPGNDTTLCGAGNRIAYYNWMGPPLAEFSYPQGGAAGKYEFLIGGVVVPLITMQSINGKVTFLEKTGTGE